MLAYIFAENQILAVHGLLVQYRILEWFELDHIESIDYKDILMRRLIKGLSKKNIFKQGRLNMSGRMIAGIVQRGFSA